jgi:hypothetical protein
MPEILQQTLTNASQAGRTGLWLVAILMLGMSVMIYLTYREANLFDGRLPKAKAHIPDREKLTAWSRSWLTLRLLLRSSDFREAVEPATSQGDTGYELRLRREIDKLVGKDVYHGQKEQL